MVTLQASGRTILLWMKIFEVLQSLEADPLFVESYIEPRSPPFFALFRISQPNRNNFVSLFIGRAGGGGALSYVKYW